MELMQDFSVTVPTDTQNTYKDNGNYQITSNLKNSKATDFFEDLYSYPPKFTIKWDSLDELTQDLFLENNYGVLEHSFPLIDSFTELFGPPFKGGSQTFGHEYSVREFINGYLDKLFSSNFYNKKTKTIQEALAPVPIFVILNGHKEIVLSKPINFVRSQAQKRSLDQSVYDYCGAFDPLVENNPKLGFFFFNRLDAENHLQEIAKSDIDGTKTVGLSIHCIGLHSAYRITREHHPDIDFRFVPHYQEVKNLLKNKLNNSNLIIDDEQQQLRFRPRSANLLPYLGKVGRILLPTRSFLQRDEYFKGVPIYIVQTLKEPRNIFVEQYFNTVNKIDSVWGRLLQFYDSALGFGDNWVMQGSLKDANVSNDYINYVFLNESDATNFIKKQGRKVARYSGSRTSNIEFMVRKPKIFVYNLEDFLESWEEKILADSDTNRSFEQKSQTIFAAGNTFFVPPGTIPSSTAAQTNTSSELESLILEIRTNGSLTPAEALSTNVNEELANAKNNPLLRITETLDLKYRLFKHYIGFLFSVGYT
tara:strand:- start:2646 stop:4247 length:1602 start_codon:yes stop_codon:yes gene_type:complete